MKNHIGSGNICWRAIMIVALVLPLLLIHPRPSVACSCGGGYSPQPVEFTGRVIAVVTARPLVKRLTDRGRISGSTLAIMFAEHHLRGPRYSFFLVASGYDADCYVYFQTGRRYAIYGKERRPGVIETTICNESGEIPFQDLR